MIGNDIVDLSFAYKESDWQRKGFLEKQFTEHEQSLIFNSKNPFQTVWLLWSMKESAYKIWIQLQNKRIFAPLRFECERTSKNTGMVSFFNKKIQTQSVFDKNYIFTLASTSKEIKGHSEIGSPLEINKNIKNKLSKETNIPSTEIFQKKSKEGAPNYYHNQKRLLESCSITHHGNYGAFTLLFSKF